jgi:hypothetical protein
VHDGNANTYYLTKDGVHKKLKPLKEKEEKVCSNARICLVDGRKFLEGMRHEHMCFAFIPRVDMEDTKEVPIEVSNFLNEFQDIFSDNVPEGLPLVRKISHQMDLIPRASFLNKVAHRMIPTKREELNKKVQELLQKGLIRENLSPCAILVVLALKKDGEWWMFIDYRAINKITINYRFPFPRMDDIIDCLSGVEYFMKIDLKSGYHHI